VFLSTAHEICDDIL